MDGFPAEIAADIEVAALALPVELHELDPDIDLEEALEDARWQTAICLSVVHLIEEEIENVKAAPEMDEAGLKRLTEDLNEYSHLYLLTALDAARLLEHARRREETKTAKTERVEHEAPAPVFTLSVVQSPRGTIAPQGVVRPAAR